MPPQSTRTGGGGGGPAAPGGPARAAAAAGGGPGSARGEAAAPTAKKKKKKGGGFLSDAFHAVTGLGGDLGRLAAGLGKEIIDQGNDQGLLDRLVSPADGEKRSIPLFDPAERRELRETQPLTYELFTSPARTAREVPDTLGAIRPGGPGFGQSMLGKEIKEHGYFGTGLAKVADVATLAGGAGLALKAVGFGRLSNAARLEQVASATSRAGGLGKAADAASLDKAAAAAAKAGDATKAADLTRAADQAREAAQLRAAVAGAGKATRVAEKTAEVARDVGRLGAQVANAPAKPYEFAARKIVGPAAKAAGRAAVDHSAVASAAAEAVGTALQRRRDIKQLRDIHYEGVTAQEQAAQFRVREVGGVSKLSKDLDPTEQAAITIYRAKEGLDPAVREAFDLLDAADQEALVRQMFGDQPVDAAAYQLAKALEDGTLPAEQAARLTDAVDTLNEAIYTEHGRRYVEGEGTRSQLSEAGLAERRAQAEGGKPVPEKVERLTEQFQAPIKRRIDKIDAEAEAIRQRNLEPRTGKLSESAKRQVARDEGRLAVEKSIARQLRKREKAGAATAERRAARTGEKTAERADRLQREANRRVVRQDEKRLATLDERRAGYEKKLDDAVKRAEDDVRAAPAQDRPALEVNRRAQTFVRDIAKEYPAEAERLASLADDIATTTKELHAKGLHPEFTFGGSDVNKAGPVVGIGAKASRRKLTSEQARKSGRLKRTVAGELESFERETHTILQNKVGEKIQAAQGSHGGTVLRDAGYSQAEIRAMTPDEMHRATLEAGGTPWQPTGSGGVVRPEDMTVNTPVIPTYLHKELTRYAVAADKAATGYKMLKVYDKATGQVKHTLLALSPKWHTGNIMGNTIMAGLGAGLSPHEMAQYFPEARRVVKAVKEGRLDDPGVLRILSSGFHAEDLAQLRELAGQGNRLTNSKAGRGLSKVVHKSYDMNQSVDSIGRVMVYLAKKGEGVSSEAAVQMSLKAMGEFSRMTPFERAVVRRIVPFYSWQRHITKLAFRLPLEAPARVAWTLHLTELADRYYGADGDDDPFLKNTVKIGDSRLSLNSFNPFGSSFFVDPSVQGAGYQMNPFLKAGVVAATGLSPNRGFKAVRTPESKFGDGAEGGFAARHPVRFGQYLSQQVPQVKQVQNFAAGEQPVRFETGQVDKNHKTGRKTLAQVAQLLGIPIPIPEQKRRR